MKIYWGKGDSGKTHLIKYARLNDKTFIQWKKYQIIKRKTKCFYYDYDVNDRLWWNIQDDWEVFHKRKDMDNIICSEFTTKEISPLYTNNEKNHYSNPQWGLESESKWDGGRKPFTREQFVKFMQRDYIDTDIYNVMVRSNAIADTCENINLYHDTLPFDRIVSDVDLMFMFQFTDGNFYDEIVYYSDFLSQHTNIIPYKGNILDSVTTKFDKVGHLGRDMIGCDLMHEYENNKDKLWNYMDGFFEYDRKILECFKKHNIPYIMFDLDADSYVDVFEWKIYPFERNMTHMQNTFNDQCHYDRWVEVEKIAKEYIYERKL